MPEGFAFFSPAEVVDSGKVYGTLLRSDDPDGCFPAVGVWQDGRVRRLVDGGTAQAANSSGTIGGTVVRDCAGKVALFRRGGVKLIPTPPSALFSFVAQLTDPGVVLVRSLVATGFADELYRRGRVIPLDLGPGNVLHSSIDRFGGRVAGTYIQPDSGSGSDDTRAFLYRTRSGTMRFLQPRPTEHVSWGLGIYDNGDVLGYSWNPGSVVGVWRNRPGRPFQTYLIEGTSQFPDVSNRLLWNKPGLIVITRTLSNSSYIVPRPGWRWTWPT